MATPQWTRIAGDFPPTLNRDTPPPALKPNETPAGYGYDLTKPGLLVAGSVPVGTARTNKTYAFGDPEVTYTWYYNRLWLASGPTLYYYAPDYTAAVYEQGLGQVNFPESASILAYMPFNGYDMAVITAAGGYVIPGAIDPRGRFQRGPLIQEVATTVAGYVTELDGTVYVSNASGLFAWRGEEVKELTVPVRNNATGFTSTALLCNYVKKWVIGTSKFVYDANTQRLYDYNTSGFLYTTPTLSMPAARPLTVYKLGFVIDRSSTATGTAGIATQIEEGSWSAVETFSFVANEGQYSWVEYQLPNPLMCRRFAARLTALSSNIYIREIHAYVDGYAQSDYSA